MIDKDFLDTWIPILVPSIYGPNKDPSKNKRILGIYIKSQKEMEEIRQTQYKDTPKNAELFGQTTNIGKLLSLTGVEDKSLINKFIILLNEAQSEECGIFTICHEIGHIHGILDMPVAHAKNTEKFADAWAFNRIKETIKDTDLRVRIYLEAFSYEKI